jgi:RHS repeat-associated protein
VSVHLPGATPKTIHYKNDALGRRIERHDVHTNAWTRYCYDGWEVRREASSDGSWVNYVNGDEMDDHLWQTRSITPTSYVMDVYLTDHQGSVRGILDGSGNLASSNGYDTFGNRTQGNSRFGYTGREHDPDTGLMYYRARWYSPETGRFISEDPIGLAGGINLYAYVGNNPLMYTDPSGHHPLGILIGILGAGALGVAEHSKTKKNEQCVAFHGMRRKMAVPVSSPQAQS